MKECPQCKGTGDGDHFTHEREWNQCDLCGGSGEMIGEETINVQINILEKALEEGTIPQDKVFESLGLKLKEKIEEESAKTNMRKYHREVKPNVFIDVYDVLFTFEVTNPGTQHALKKLLAAGGRGYKSKIEDLKEAIVSINRAIELEEENERKAD
jgi:hypothetical protein